MINNKDKSKQALLFYARSVMAYPYNVLGILLALPVTILFNQILPPLLISHVLKRLTTGDFVPGQVWQSFGPDIVLYSVIVLSSGIIFWRVVDMLVWRLEGNMQRDLVRRVFNHLIGQSADFHANRYSGSLVSQTNKLLGSYMRIADTTIFMTIPLIISLVAISIILLPRAPLFVACLIVFSILYVIIGLRASRPVRVRGALHAKAESKQTGYLSDAISNIMAIKSFSGEKSEEKAFNEISEHTRRKLVRVMVSHQKQMLFFSGAFNFILAMAFLLAIISVVLFKADIATVFLIFSYTGNIADRLFQFSNNALRNYNRGIGDASDMVDILATETEIRDPENPEPIKMQRGGIQLDDVEFTHKDANEAIFDKLNLRIKPGEKVGLVGHSGSGKSTLVRLLLRFSNINGGSISIDGQNITSVTQQDLRSKISYVPQEPLLFHRTISENIAFSHPNADKREIIAVAKQANAHSFIEKLPKGYDTLVGERGVKLSGGQRQRVAIARAMFKNAPILVLDEATSALDSESEALIQDALWKLMEGRTAIVIAHRLSTIQKMDRIIVLDNGKIVEEGGHKDLIYKNGIYAKLWNHQSGGFLEE